MKSLKLFLFVVCAAALFISCKSAKSLQNELRFLRFDLDYELTSNIHSGERNKTLYLNEIDNSNMEYFTSVPKAGSLVLPFILLNYWQKKYTVVLGEASLTQAYCEFLSDALLAECNRSAAFNLKLNSMSIVPGDTYLLDMKIVHNETKSGIKASKTVLFIPPLMDGFDFNMGSYRVLPTESNLEVAVCLTKGNQVLFEKQYRAKDHLDGKNTVFDTSPDVNEACVIRMIDCLSVVTRNIVTSITNDLNVILSVKQ